MVLNHYDLELVIYSIVAAFILCYLATLSIQQLRIRSSQNKHHKIFLILSGFLLGLAVWISFFLVILATDIPNTFHFDYGLALVSFLISFIASTFAIWTTALFHLNITRLILGSILMGLGIAGMHYVGIMGLLIDNYLVIYQPIIMVFTVLLAICGAGFAIYFNFHKKKKLIHKSFNQVGFASIMAFSIVGMHYAGMLSISFYKDLEYEYEFLLNSNHNLILFSIIAIAAVIFLISGVIAFLEQRLDERNRQLTQANQDLANQAKLDTLTKLPNRLFLTEYVHQLLSEKNTHTQKSAFLYIDVDRFKAVNDVFGHHVGDRLLIQLANRIHKNLNSNEKLFRIGGDEFLLLIEHTTIISAQKTAERLQSVINERFLIEGKEINISVSIGVALFHEHGQNLQDLLMNADAAMLKSKHQGRNTYTIFNYSDELLKSQNQTKLMNDLYKAVEEKQFILFYQPKFTAQKHTICGVEALIRWQHPTHGLLTPNMFMQGAEATGVIIQMGYWVIEEAFKQIQKWEQAGIHLFPLALNLSVVQFEHRELFSTLEKLFDRYQINPSHLIIEITESTAMHNIEMSILRFERLRQMGIKLAIDDFGTGYSSLLYLKSLAIDELKIDRAFIQDLERNSKSEIILESIINLAIKLGLTVTVEGVETPMQVEKLTKLGCQQLQGFLFSMPIPVEELEKWDLKYSRIDDE